MVELLCGGFILWLPLHVHSAWNKRGYFKIKKLYPWQIKVKTNQPLTFLSMWSVQIISTHTTRHPKDYVPSPVYNLVLRGKVFARSHIISQTRRQADTSEYAPIDGCRVFTKRTGGRSIVKGRLGKKGFEKCFLLSGGGGTPSILKKWRIRLKHIDFYLLLLPCSSAWGLLSLAIVHSLKLSEKIRLAPSNMNNFGHKCITHCLIWPVLDPINGTNPLFTLVRPKDYLL